MSRIYQFDNIMNFRDFGDHRTADGARVKVGKLFRSAHFSAASQSDLNALEELNIGLVVDLRHKPERKRQPNKWPSGQAPKVLQYPDPKHASEELAPHERFIKEALNTPQDARNYMQGSYEARPHDPGFKSIFSDTLKVMAESGEPIVIHCAAGKDRTGTLAAVILSALGVPFETILQDYMLTMEAIDIDMFLKPAAVQMGTRYGREYDANALRPLFHVEPGYLERSMKTIENVDSYISDTLGITQAERQALRDHYLES